MATQQDYILKFDADTSGVTSAVEQTTNAVEGLGGVGDAVFGQIDKLTGGLAGKLKNVVTGVGKFTKGLNLTKVALIGTGIGAFVVALGAVVTYFTQSFEGARKLKVILEGVSAGIQVIVDRVSKFGESVVKFFSGDREGAVKAFTEATADLGDELQREFKIAQDLERARQALIDRQREQLVTTARERAEIKALNLLAEDTTANINDRIAAAEEAGSKERALFEQRKADAEEELRILTELNDLGNSTEEDRQRQAELEARIFELTSESLELQTTLQNKLNTLKLEAVNLTRQQLQAEIDLANETVKAMEERQTKELETLTVTQEAEAATLKTVQTTVNQQVLATESAEAEKQRLQRKTQEDFLNNAELIGNQSLEFASLTLQAVGALSEAFTKDEDKRAERSFKIGKKLATVQTIINTAEAVTSALAKDGTFPGSRFIAAAAAGAAGIAQLATIKRQEFEGGATASIQTPQRQTLTAPATGTAPQLDLGFLGAGAGQTGFRTYVVSSEVSNAQQANQRINDQASLVG
jgi:hypothetical protein